MKKIIAITFLFASAIASAQNDAAEDTTATPAFTAIGKPDGEKTEMKIGKEGGSFTSSDRKVSLIIPEGAVSKKTIFIIQPTTNLMPNGNGKAYRLEPSGIQFQKPVQLVFHYDPEEYEDSMQLLMAIAMQDDEGQWYGLNKFILDTVAKTISGNINHFSVWATFDKLNLISGKKRLKVTKETSTVILGVNTYTTEDRERIRQIGTESAKKFMEKFEKFYQEKYINVPLSPLKSWKPPQKVKWSVNGIKKRNAEFGTLVHEEADESVANVHVNRYTAPRNVPDKNPVTIRVDLVGASYVINGIKSLPLYLETQILIYDNAYEVIMISRFDSYVGEMAGNVTYLDAGSFIVSLNGKDTKIIEKQNENALSNLGYNEGKCTLKPINEGHGNIHIVGAASMNVIPSQSSSQPATVIIKFIPTPVILPLLSFSCPNRKGGPTTGTTAEGNAMLSGFMVKAFPIEIRFKAIEGEQTIQQFGNPGESLYYKCTVKQIEDD